MAFNYHYDIIAADIDYHVRKHPQQDLKDRGLHWTKCEPFSIADCWIFRFDNELDNPPSYLVKVNDDFKFSNER